jgi:archaeal flagellar protein FlaC
MGKEEENTDSSDEEDTTQKKETKPETVESDDDDKELKTEKVDNLRKVIKLDNKTSEEKTDETETDVRKNLEQKREILQSIKDFDFQIKKSQEEITTINNKIDSITKDIGDLISLYEIVSEQMNPFVGLSKVTKKRLDALENFTREIEELKDRIGDIESFAVKTGADIKMMGKKEELDANIETVDETADEETSVGYIDPSNSSFGDLPVSYKSDSDDYLDEIIEKSLRMLSIESRMDKVIDEFIENLKA